MNQQLTAHLIAIKQQHILDAAARVFAEKGFHAASVKDVAQAAGVAQGSIYNHFENKAALLLGLFDLMTARARQEVPQIPDEHDPHAVLRMALRQPLVAMTSGNAELFRVVVSEVLVNRDFAARFQTQILEPMIHSAATLFGLNVGGAPSPDNLKLRAVAGLILGMILVRVMGDEVVAQRWDELPDLLADLLIGGLEGKAK